MRELTGSEGEEVLRALVRQRPLFGFDFDGTLAPIVSRPDDARVSSAIARLMQRLVACAPVAIVTGRAVADVTPRLGFAPTFVIGNHGAEDPLHVPSAGEEQALDALRARIAQAQDDLVAAGVTVEDKGLSIALHYRLARDRGLAIAAITALLDNLDPRLREFGGKCIINITAAHAPDKADAMFDLVKRAGCGAALFVGDDINDEVVFERAPPKWVTVRVGHDERTSRARYFVDGPTALAPLIQRLLAMLHPR